MRGALSADDGVMRQPAPGRAAISRRGRFHRDRTMKAPVYVCRDVSWYSAAQRLPGGYIPAEVRLPTFRRGVDRAIGSAVTRVGLSRQTRWLVLFVRKWSPGLPRPTRMVDCPPAGGAEEPLERRLFNRKLPRPAHHKVVPDDRSARISPQEVIESDSGGGADGTVLKRRR